MAIEYRPWGYYKILTQGHNYKVKELHIFSGENISKQYHQHRDEFWYVVEGYGVVELEKTSHELRYRSAITIPARTIHKAWADDELTIIEIQFGSYLEEDDIVRLEDKYGRTDATTEP
jgi:mannose-6-phosphate isomerase-like protein (cupin superfamily)